MAKIKITGINTNMDTSLVFFLKNGHKIPKEQLEGSLLLEITDGKLINAKQELDINRISEKLKSELYYLFQRMEDELNGATGAGRTSGGTSTMMPGAFSGALPNYVGLTSSRAIGEESSEEEVADQLIESDKVYITDQYAKALKSINEEIGKQIELRSSLSVESKEYRDSLEEEIKLEMSKSQLLKMAAVLIEAKLQKGI